MSWKEDIRQSSWGVEYSGSESFPDLAGGHSSC